ncbi:hypothetical protein F5887DRAFT_1078226 [Amanita rubescens]|nr:hypothetical protein F5887DRAFT_1078226 [Amanita rubescens]
MLPEFQTVLSYLQMQASIFRSDYGDILGIETLQVIDEFIDAATDLCRKVSQNSSTSQEPSQSQLTSESWESESDVELPEVVLEFHRWAQGPPPSWLQEFEVFRSKLGLAASGSSVTETDTAFEKLRPNAPKRAASESSVTETDSEFEQFRPNVPKRAASESSVTETDTEFERFHSNAPKRAASESSVTETDTEFERFHSNVPKRAASESSVTETDTEFEKLRSNAPKQAASESSVTETDTEFEQGRPNAPRTVASQSSVNEIYSSAPAAFITTIKQLIDQLYDLRSSASRTVQELHALASGVEFCCIIFLFMLVFIRLNGLNACHPEHKADYNHAIKLSARHLFDALDCLQIFVAVRFILFNKPFTIIEQMNRVLGDEDVKMAKVNEGNGRGEDGERGEIEEEDIQMGEVDEDVEMGDDEVDENRI